MLLQFFVGVGIIGVLISTTCCAPPKLPVPWNFVGVLGTLGPVFLTGPDASDCNQVMSFDP